MLILKFVIFSTLLFWDPVSLGYFSSTVFHYYHNVLNFCRTDRAGMAFFTVVDLENY